MDKISLIALCIIALKLVLADNDKPIFIIEIFGHGAQDLYHSGL